MNSRYSQAPVVESLERIICSDIRRSDTSSATTTVNESSPHESLTDSFLPPPSLATCVSSYGPVQPQSIAELRTWLAQAFPVSHSASQASGAELMTKEICGPLLGMSFAMFDPTTSNWKTCQVSLLPDTQASSSVIWPRWAMWDERVAYELPTPELCIDATAGGLWPTPRANDPEKRGDFANDPRNGLPAAAKYWATPSATEGKGAPTGDALEKRKSMTRGVRLCEQVARMLPTPTANRWDGLQSHGVNVVSGQLNPEWVEWLMGWPIGWTDLKPLATDKFQEWLQQHGNF